MDSKRGDGPAGRVGADQPEVDGADGEAVLFAEAGASWLWLIAGPLAALAALYLETSSGHGMKPLLPLIFLVLVTGFLALQVKAARTHTSVVLTATTLRQGTEAVPVDQILAVYPEPENSVRAGRNLEPWQLARALGELSGVPRGRTGIGVKLTGQRTAQAWARRHRELRAALTGLVAAAPAGEPGEPGGPS